MKKRSPAKTTPKASDVKEAIGGQPENDQDAREAGLSSATSAHGGEKTERGAKRSPRAPAKTKNGR